MSVTVKKVVGIGDSGLDNIVANEIVNQIGKRLLELHVKADELMGGIMDRLAKENSVEKADIKVNAHDIAVSIQRLLDMTYSPWHLRPVVMIEKRTVDFTGGNIGLNLEVSVSLIKERDTKEDIQ